MLSREPSAECIGHVYQRVLSDSTSVRNVSRQSKRVPGVMFHLGRRLIATNQRLDDTHLLEGRLQHNASIVGALRHSVPLLFLCVQDLHFQTRHWWEWGMIAAIVISSPLSSCHVHSLK